MAIVPQILVIELKLLLEDEKRAVRKLTLKIKKL